jgi:hypothetical protein
MIDKNYFKEIGMDAFSDEYIHDELIEKTVTIRLPKKIFEKIQIAMEWRSLSFEQHIEREVVLLAIKQADSLSKLMEDQKVGG